MIPVTTAHAERCFSKMSLVKSKLRFTMSQDRLESLMFCSVEKEILLSLDNNNLIYPSLHQLQIGGLYYPRMIS